MTRGACHPEPHGHTEALVYAHSAASKDLSKPTDKAKSAKPEKREKESKVVKPSQQVKKDSSPPRVIAAQNDSGLPAKFQSTLDFTKKLISLLENPAEVTYEITEKSFNINVTGNGVGQIIGKGGEVLNAIQTLISSIAIAHSAGEQKRVYFNVEDYKERREETLKSLAARKAEKVKETGRPIKLEPMNARERAIIHSALQDITGIRTYSTGKDPFRCLCIAPARKDD